MTMHWNALRSVATPLVAWLRVVSDRSHLMFGPFPHLRDAFGANDLPLSFILRRDSHRRKVGNGKRHNPVPPPAGKSNRVSSVHLIEHRAHVRSALRPNRDRSKHDRVA